MKVAKYVEGVVVIADLSVFYPSTSFAEDGPSPDFVEEEGIFFVDNNVTFDPKSQKVISVAPYIDGAIARSVQVVPFTEAELDEIRQRKSGKVIDDIKADASRRLDEFAQSRGYDNIVSVTSYANSTKPQYVIEANRAIYLRDEWWGILTIIMNDVLAGNRALPSSLDDLLSELPELTWE